MDRRFVSVLVAAVVAVTLVGAPVTMADWGEQAELSVEPVERSAVDDGVPVLQYQNLSPTAQQAVRRAIESPDGSHIVYGDEDAPDRFAYSDYTEPGYGLYVVVYEGDSYRLQTYAAGGFPFVYWLMELPFVAYGVGLLWVARRTNRRHESPSRTLALAGVGLGFHLLGPALDFPLVSPTAFAALGIVATAGVAGVVTSGPTADAAGSER